MRDKSLKMSIPREKKIHGIEVKKMKCGEFIAALEELNEFPARIVSKIFGGDVNAAINTLKGIDKDGVFALITRLLFILPEEVIEALNKLIGIPREKIEALGVTELLEVIEAWYDINDVTDFFVVARRLKAKAARGFGFSGGSPSEKASD